MTRNMKKVVGRVVLTGGVALAGLGLASGTAQAFNPQPDPPGRQATAAVNPPQETQSKPGIIAVNPQTRIHVAAQGGAA
jgi:hypothetical protein